MAIVNLTAQTHVSVHAIRDAGGVVPHTFLKRFGGARVERGTRITVDRDVADTLTEHTHESYEKGREGEMVPSWTREY